MIKGGMDCMAPVFADVLGLFAGAHTAHMRPFGMAHMAHERYAMSDTLYK